LYQICHNCHHTDADDIDPPSARFSSVPPFKGEKSSYPDWVQRNEEALDADAIARLSTDPKVESTDDALKNKNAISLKQNKTATALLNTAWGDAMGIFDTKTYTANYPRGSVERFEEKKIINLTEST
jgi:hypothetical protein